MNRKLENTKHGSIFMGGIPTTLTEAALETILEKKWGDSVPFSVYLPRHATNPSLNKGYAFLRLKDPEDSVKLAGKYLEIEGRPIQLMETNSKNKLSSTATLEKRLFMSGVPYGISDLDLTKKLSKICNCSSAYSIRDRNGVSKGFGYVMLDSKEEADKLLKLRGWRIDGREVGFQEPKKLVEKTQVLREDYPSPSTLTLNLPTQQPVQNEFFEAFMLFQQQFSSMKTMVPTSPLLRSKAHAFPESDKGRHSDQKTLLKNPDPMSLFASATGNLSRFVSDEKGLIGGLKPAGSMNVESHMSSCNGKSKCVQRVQTSIKSKIIRVREGLELSSFLRDHSTSELRFNLQKPDHN